jgi:NADH-quinone oxidoreductase subunit L
MAVSSRTAIFINAEAHPVMEELAHHFHGAAAMALHAVQTPVFWLAAGGVALSWFFYLKRPDIPGENQERSHRSTPVLENKYYFDKFNEVVCRWWCTLAGTRTLEGGRHWPDRRFDRERLGARVVGFWR